MASKARAQANLLGSDGKIKATQFGTGSITSDFLDSDAVSPAAISNKDNTSTGYFDLPAGTTGERPDSPNVGHIRYNSTLGFLEQYTADGWQGIAPPPTISSTNVTNVDESDSDQVVIITGQNFDTTAVGSLIDTNGVTKTPTTSVRNSSSQITITYSGGDVLTASVPEPLDVKVTNGSGLSAILEDQINIDASPIWSTSAGTLATISDVTTGTHATLSATDPEGESVSYSVATGALPGGLSLNSSTGVISGDPTNVDGSTQSNFTVDADDGTGNVVNRSFNIIVTPTNDGTSAARGFTNVQSADGYISNGEQYYVQTSSGNYEQLYFYEFNNYAYALVAVRYKSTGNQTVVNQNGAYGTMASSGNTWGLGVTKINFLINQTGMLMIPQEADGQLVTSNFYANLFRSSNTNKDIDTDIFTNNNAGEGSNGTSVRGMNLSTFNPSSYPTDNWYDLDTNSHEGGNQILSYFGGSGAIHNGGVEPLGLRWSNANGAGYQDGANAGNDVSGGARNLSSSPPISLFLLAR